jgi:hypothetical protein
VGGVVVSAGAGLTAAPQVRCGGAHTRLPGWEQRLAWVLESYRHRPYALGSNDCIRLACDTVQALTGEGLWHLLMGRYQDRDSAIRLVHQWGRTWSQAFSALFGEAPRMPYAARRGDILTFDDARDKHLAVCAGPDVAVYGPQGLGFVPLTDARLLECWRIG